MINYEKHFHILSTLVILCLKDSDEGVASALYCVQQVNTPGFAPGLL